VQTERDLVTQEPQPFDDTLGVLRIDSRRKRSRRASRRILLAVVLVAIVAAAGASRFWARPVEVQVTRAVLVNPTAPVPVLTAAGYIVPRRKVELSPKITGRIEWVGVDQDSQVKKGQVLIRLEQRDLQAQLAQARANTQAAEARLQQLLAGSREEDIEQAQAAVEEAQANVVLAEVNLKRTEKLFAEGLVARQLIDDGRNQSDTARAKLKAAKERLRLVKAGPRPEEIQQARAELRQTQASVELAEANLDNTLIRAPMDGTILERLAEPGETVTTTIVSQRGAKSAMLSMADLRDLLVEVDINQSDLKKLRLRMPAVVTPDAHPERRYQGVLTEMAPEANRQKATLQVKVQISKPDAFIRPEMNARVVFEEPPKNPAGPARVLLPKEAVLQRGERRVVYQIVDGKAVERLVTLGEESGGQVEIRSGLQGGETVAVGVISGLKSGQVVQTKP
jgi:HlyD family secretion protein